MITGIVAVEKNQGIGFNGQMPWPRLKGDMYWFKKMTAGNVVIMGSTTFESIGKPLPDRINVVLSRKKDFSPQADHTFSDPDLALEFCKKEYPDKEIFIIGGSEIYRYYMPVIDRFLITEIDQDYICDKFFDLFYVRENFTDVKEHATFNEQINYKIKEYKYESR